MCFKEIHFLLAYEKLKFPDPDKQGWGSLKQIAKVIHFNRIITHYEEFKPLFCVFCACFMF